MFRHVIVGVDGCPSGRDAIALARLLAARDARRALAHVDELTPIGAASFAFGDVERDAKRMLEQERETAAVDAELISLVASSVGRGLHSLAESEGADLLVVGSCHRGFAGRVLMGNDTRAALNGAPCAVAVAPLGYAQHSGAIATIGVGYDGSPESETALAVARQIAAQHAAQIHALQVVQIPLSPYAGVAWGDALDTMLADARERMAAMQGVEGEAVLGLTGEELAAFGARVDLLVVGSRGYGPLRRLMLGSTSEHLAGHARCPLLVLPRPATDGPGPHEPAARAGATAAGSH